jgi:hypothetical protein
MKKKKKWKKWKWKINKINRINKNNFINIFLLFYYFIQKLSLNLTIKIFLINFNLNNKIFFYLHHFQKVPEQN